MLTGDIVKIEWEEHVRLHRLEGEIVDPDVGGMTFTVDDKTKPYPSIMWKPDRLALVKVPSLDRHQVIGHRHLRVVQSAVPGQ